MNIKIYYGLSGALKGSTIESIKKKQPDLKVMESSIKAWKYYQFGIYNGLTEYNDEHSQAKDDVLIERGVTDSLFYYYYNDEFSSGKGKAENSEFIEKVVQAERSVLLPDFSKIERILLVQNDKDFVRDVVLKDEYRKKTFKNDPDLYFQLQEKYVEFTSKYNPIDSIIRIDNAEEYITKTLGEHWN